MKIYEGWLKIKVHLIVVSVIFVLVSCLRFIFADRVYDVFYINYVVNSIAITVSCIILAVKRGFLWYYPVWVIFAATVCMLIFFKNDITEGLISVFISYVSAAFVSSAVGAIVHKIRENNKEE